MPARPSAPRFRVESLEDRVTPAVTAALNAGTLTVTLDAANDAATVTGTGAGTDLSVNDGTTTQTFTGVDAIVVSDGGTGGGSPGQSVTFADAGAGTGIVLPGSVTVTGVETVTVGTANGDLRALSVGIVNAATRIALAAGVTTTDGAGQVYGGPVVVGAAGVAAVTLDAGAAGGVQFTQPVDGLTAGANGLTVNAGGATRFDGTVGATARPATLTTDAAGTTTFAANVTTDGAQSYADPVTVSGAAVTFTSGTAGVAFPNSLDAQTAGANGVAVNAPLATRFAAAVGGVVPLAAVGTDAPGTTEIASNVVTTGSQTYGDPVTVSGAGVVVSSSATGAVTFRDAVTAAVSDTTSLTVATAGVTTFAGGVGSTRLLSLTTDAPGSTVVGVSSAATTVATSGAQTFNDPVRVDATAATFASSNNAAVLFAGTLNGNVPGASSVVVNTGGTTTFGGVAGAVTTLGGLTTDAPGTTVLAGSVSTTGAQSYGDPVTVTPATGVTAVALTTSAGAIAFGGAVTGASAVPLTTRAGGDLTFGGNVTLSATGSSLTAQAGGAGTGALAVAAGVTIRADALTIRVGDGPGGAGTTATADLLTTAPQLRNAAGTAAPGSFVFRQDGPLSDAALPAAAQFGGTYPRSVALVSDDGALTLASAVVAGAQTTDLLLSAAQALTVSTPINAPTGTVRLRSVAANVAQPATGTITAAAVGVRASTGIDLAFAPNAVATVAAQTTTGDVRYASATPVTAGSITADPRTGLFTPTAGAQSGSGAVAFITSGTTALDLTVAAPLAGSSVTAAGGAGANRVAVNYSLGATLANGLVFTGGAGTDSLSLTDAGATTVHTYTVNGTVVRDNAAPITLSGVENLSITGGDGADVFTVTPNGTYAVTIDGGGPTATPGDTLTVSPAGATATAFTASRTGTGLQGSAAFVDRRTVTFSAVESLTPSADIRVSATTTAAVAGGETGTISVTVTNAGPAAVTGVRLTDVFPVGLTATWTATASAGSSVAAASGTGDINTTADLAASGTVTFTIQLTASGSARGTLTNTFTAGPPPAAFELDATNNAGVTTITAAAAELFAVGAGPGGGPVVVAYNPDGTERFRRFAFDTAYSGGVTVGTGDVNGDGFEDVVAGSAVGASRVTVFDGRTGNELATFFAFPDFTGGVNVAVAGGRIVAGAGVGGGPVVAEFTLGASGVQEVARFLAFDESFRGGVQVGGSERLLAVGAGPGGGPHVKLFDAATLAQTASFFAFPVGSTDGVSVAVGGTATAPTVVVGSGLGSRPVAATFNATTPTPVGSFQAFESSFRGGVRVASGGTVGTQTTTVVAPGGGGSSRVRIVAADQTTTVRDFFAFESAFTGGVYVG